MNELVKQFEQWLQNQNAEIESPTLKIEGIQNADSSPVYSSGAVQLAWLAFQEASK